MNTTKPQATTCSGLLREAAALHPERTAYIFDDRHTTFAEFDATVSRWAKGLLHLGVQRGEAISVLAGNHPHFLHLAFAAARIGAHLAPLNTWHTPDELQYTLNHSDAVALFTVDILRARNFNAAVSSFLPELNESHAGRTFAAAPELRDVVSLGQGLPGMMNVESLLEGAQHISDDQLHEREQLNAPSDLMYLLYTSGSTSKPKAVMLHQGDAIENGYQIGVRQGIDETDRAWLVTPLFYGVAALQALFATWTHFGTIVLQEAFEPSAALEILERHRCTVYFGFGNLTRKLLAAPGFDKAKVFLRKGMIGFSVEDRRLAIEELGVEHGVSVYGLTETYGLAALTDYRDPKEVVMTTQGKPLPGVDIRIVNPETGQPVEAGVVGAITVRGRTTSGYYKDPVRSMEAFTADGYFLTGDLGRYDRDGRLQFQDRSGEMIKTGGVNVSPQEVEMLLDRVPGIRQAHVCAVHDEEQGQAVAAFIDADADLSPDVIRQQLKAVAASYKIPKYFFYRSDDSLPRLASGKISLPALKKEAAELVSGAVEAR